MNIYDTITSLSGNPLLQLFILVIGSYGWWRFLARDSILDRIRNWFWSKFPHEGFTAKDRPSRGYSVYSGGVWYTQIGTKLGELVHCPFCLSFWVGLALFASFATWPTLTLGICLAQLPRVVTAFLAEKIG